MKVDECDKDERHFAANENKLFGEIHVYVGIHFTSSSVYASIASLLLSGAIQNNRIVTLLTHI